MSQADFPAGYALLTERLTAFGTFRKRWAISYAAAEVHQSPFRPRCAMGPRDKPEDDTRGEANRCASYGRRLMSG